MTAFVVLWMSLFGMGIGYNAHLGLLNYNVPPEKRQEVDTIGNRIFSVVAGGLFFAVIAVAIMLFAQTFYVG